MGLVCVLYSPNEQNGVFFEETLFYNLFDKVLAVVPFQWICLIVAVVQNGNAIVIHPHEFLPRIYILNFFFLLFFFLLAILRYEILVRNTSEQQAFSFRGDTTMTQKLQTLKKK